MSLPRLPQLSPGRERAPRAAPTRKRGPGDDPAGPLRRAGRAGGPGGRVPRADTSALPATAWVCGSGPRRRMALSLLIPGLRPALFLSGPLGLPLSGSPFLQVSPSLGIPRSPVPPRRAPGGDRAAEGEALRSCRPSHREAETDAETGARGAIPGALGTGCRLLVPRPGAHPGEEVGSVSPASAPREGRPAGPTRTAPRVTHAPAPGAPGLLQQYHPAPPPVCLAGLAQGTGGAPPPPPTEAAQG